MKWEQYRSVMERYAIKTDDMASEDAYFMATHMPFSSLEIYTGGRVSAPAVLMSEEEVFEKLICNPENEHRMIIVRGDNGTGKSHLIRYFKARFVNSPATVYNPATEQLVFLRRLNNSVRGALSQLLEQNVISDPEVKEKLRKFVASADSKDEAAFKNDIMYSYAAAVRSDRTGKVYQPVICRDIASYLSDSRVMDSLMQEGGAISRCYDVITASSNRILHETAIFREEDFNQQKLIRSVIKQGDPQASDFAATLKGDEDEIRRLVKYLNTFTREVVQRCADISSESTKNVFVQMRRDLKRQGKNLTLFIEDFTGFTGIDSELITVLSTEHGGDYEDLCRVTAVIGITNDYYDQFRDNFTDRVTHQISVTDRSFGTEEFLTQMAGRYLNAIYCDPEELRKWERTGAVIADLPISQFSTPCPWESVQIGERHVTLYPFNRRSLMTLYEALPVKSPRMYLKNVIRAQLKEYFDGKNYGDEWDFPLNTENIQMAKDTHSSAIDRMETMSAQDRHRLKAVFAIWGDGSAAGLKDENGIITFGSVSKSFLDDIGLAGFQGIGPMEDRSGGSSEEQTHTTEKEEDHSEPPQPKQPEPEAPKRRVTESPEEKNYRKHKEDITAWFTQNKPLLYDDDYRGWLRILVRGDARQCGAINWQDMGIPAYIAEKRLSDLGGYYIEAQKSVYSPERVIVYMDKSVESRDALLALNEMSYAKGWDFDGAPYYQQRLITWLERRKNQIIENVTGVAEGNQKLPVLEWCLNLQYLKACILGQTVDTSTPLSAVCSLFRESKKDSGIVRETKEWKDLVQFLDNKDADFESARTLLVRSAATTMGAIHYSDDSSTSAFYRVDELLNAAELMIASDWNIERDLPQDIPSKHLLYQPAAMLRALYPRIQKTVAAENEEIESVIEKLTEYIGTLNEENLLSSLRAIQDLFSAFAVNGVLGSSELRTKYEKPPIDTANIIMRSIEYLEHARTVPQIQQLETYSHNSLHILHDFLRDIQSIAKKAETEETKARSEMSRASGVPNVDRLGDAARLELSRLYHQVEQMGVYEDAAD